MDRNLRMSGNYANFYQESDFQALESDEGPNLEVMQDICRKQELVLLAQELVWLLEVYAVFAVSLD